MRALTLCFLLLAFAIPAQADIADDCTQDTDMDLKIGGCTAVIRSGEWTGENLAWAYNNRGVGYSKSGEFRAAVENYDKAINLKSNYPAAINNRGYAYSNMGEYRRALEDYNLALAYDPNMATAITNRGVAYRQLCRHEEAFDDFMNAIRIVGTTRAREWQVFLRDLGHYTGSVDGDFGAGSRVALRSYVYAHSC